MKSTGGSPLDVAVVVGGRGPDILTNGGIYVHSEKNLDASSVCNHDEKETNIIQ